MLKEQLDAYREEGIESMLVVPMRIGQERGGTLVFYYRAPGATSVKSTCRPDRRWPIWRPRHMTTAALVRTNSASSRARGGIGAAAGRVSRRCRSRSVAVTRLRRHADHGRQGWRYPRLPIGAAVDIVRPSGEVQPARGGPRRSARRSSTRANFRKRTRQIPMPGGVHEVIRTEKPVLVTSFHRRCWLVVCRIRNACGFCKRSGLRLYMCVPIVSPGGRRRHDVRLRRIRTALHGTRSGLCPGSGRPCRARRSTTRSPINGLITRTG